MSGSPSLLTRALARAGGAESLVQDLGADNVAELVKVWEVVAREEQYQDPDKTTTLWLAGRGFGKSFCLSGGLHQLVAAGHRRIAVVAPTASDVRDTMVEGPSGILAWAPREHAPPGGSCRHHWRSSACRGWGL